MYVNNFNGGTTSAFFNGEIFTTGAYIPSDISLKTNVQNFANALDILDQLEVKQYDYNQALYPSMVLPSGSQVGLMADNVNSVAPQLIRQFSNPSSYDTSGNTIFPQVDFFAVNYTGLIPYLVSAIKEQQHQLDSLAQALSLCCASPIVNPQSNRSALTLTNHASIILNQNSPNPFKEKTDIQYSIPDNVGEAMLVFYDSKGTILSTFEIEHKGEGTLTVYGENLSAGIYTYSLVVDGQVFKTKKMVKE